MKSREEIKRKLDEIYDHRLSLRIERYTRRNCRNCVNGVNRNFDLGDFGSISRWECKNGVRMNGNCSFSCRWNEDDIRDDMISEISDPAICGAKEPKIAMLMWILHDTVKDSDSSEEGNCELHEELHGCGIFSRIRKFFSSLLSYFKK